MGKLRHRCLMSCPMKVTLRAANTPYYKQPNLRRMKVKNPLDKRLILPLFGCIWIWSCDLQSIHDWNRLVPHSGCSAHRTMPFQSLSISGNTYWSLHFRKSKTVLLLSVICLCCDHSAKLTKPFPMVYFTGAAQNFCTSFKIFRIEEEALTSRVLVWSK